MFALLLLGVKVRNTFHTIKSRFAMLPHSCPPQYLLCFLSRFAIPRSVHTTQSGCFHNTFIIYSRFALSHKNTRHLYFSPPTCLLCFAWCQGSQNHTSRKTTLIHSAHSRFAIPRHAQNASLVHQQHVTFQGSQ